MVLTNKQKFNKKYKQKLNEPNSKKDISKLSGVSMSILDDVYYRGMGAFKTNPQSVRKSVSSPQQWEWLEYIVLLLEVKLKKQQMPIYGKNI